MAPKHGLSGLNGQSAKRQNTGESPVSRSATPADTSVKVPFKVEYPKMNSAKKLLETSKELEGTVDFHISPFNAKLAQAKGELDQFYAITPHDEWESMKKYNNFIIQGEVYKNDQFVFVRGEDTPRDKDTEGRPKDFWVARILQVRAKNAQHVYALVAWMYWSDELPPPPTRSKDQVSKDSGKRTYHGSHELLASNWMEVLDVLTFAGKADVQHWPEEDDNLQSKLYWRQTYNRNTGELSPLRKHCICNGYFNPEVTMYICDNPACKIWIHDNHLIDDILTKTFERVVLGDSKTNGATKPSAKKGKTPPYKGAFKATIKEIADSPPMAHITDLRPGADPKAWDEAISCPKCDTPYQ